MATKRPLVYLAGPMTNRDGTLVEIHLARALSWFLPLVRLRLPVFCPHLCGGFHSCWELVGHAEWLAYDHAILKHCRAVVFLPGWEHSAGAQAEHEFALGHVLRRLYSWEELQAWWLDETGEDIGSCPAGVYRGEE